MRRWMPRCAVRIRDAYGTRKYDRLRALKRRDDPDNFFRMNQNIPPA
jgi:FAD/FMN-containing dehydrogenase